MVVKWLITEKRRNEDKLERLLNRNDKVLNQIIKSRQLNSKNIYLPNIHPLHSRFVLPSGTKISYLKQEITCNKKGEPRWAKPIPAQ